MLIELNKGLFKYFSKQNFIGSSYNKYNWWKNPKLFKIVYLLEQVLKFDYMYAMYFKPKFEFFFGYLYLRKDLKSGDAQKCLYVLLVYTSKSGPMLVVLLSMSMSGVLLPLPNGFCGRFIFCLYVAISLKQL